MRARRVPPVFLLFAGLTLGCTGRESPTGVLAAKNAVRSVQAADNGESQGAVLVRFEDRFLFIALDYEKELLASHGWTDGFPAICGDAVTVIHLADFQLVLNPADQDLIMQLLKADKTFVRVYDWTGQPDINTTLCSGRILYRGIGKLVNTDNDLFPGDANADRPRTNAFGFTAQGTLSDPGGSEVHYNAVQRFVLDIAGDGTVTRFRENRTISVRPLGRN